jgi:hypothetical protein
VTATASGAASGAGPGAAARPNRARRIFQRGNLPLIGVVLLVALLLVASAVGNRPAQPPPFDLDSTADDGLAALRLWLEELGYDVRRSGGMQFALSPGTELLFVYPNLLAYTPAEAETLRAWVEAGGALVLVGPGPEDTALERAFGVRSQPGAAFAPSGEQTQPLLPEGAAEYAADWTVENAVLDLQDAPAAVPLLQSSGGDVAMAVQSVGQGVVWHLAPGHAFANRGLREEDHGQLLPPLLRTVSPGGVVVFDTFHQSGLLRVGEQIVTLQDWLYRTPAGWATLFSVAAAALFLVLGGRRLGPPVVTWSERRRREAAEYVEAMALLSQRAGLAADVAAHLDDAVFVERLAYSEPPLPPDQVAAVARTLQALRGKPTPSQLATLAAEVDRLLG